MGCITAIGINVLQIGSMTTNQSKILIVIDHAFLGQMYWLRGVAVANPFKTSHFLWLDVGRCPHLVDPPLNFSFLLPAARQDKFVIFAAYDKVTQCFGTLSRTRRSRHRRAAAGATNLSTANVSEAAWEPREILRAQLMGGSAKAVDRVARLYDKLLIDWMRRGEVFDKEEPVLTLAWDMVRIVSNIFWLLLFLVHSLERIFTSPLTRFHALLIA